jgi:hypothetical protein
VSWSVGLRRAEILSAGISGGECDSLRRAGQQASLFGGADKTENASVPFLPRLYTLFGKPVDLGDARITVEPLRGTSGAEPVAFQQGMTLMYGAKRGQTHFP